MWRKGWCGEDGVKVTLCNACGACVRMSRFAFFLDVGAFAFGGLTRDGCSSSSSSS